MSPRYIFVDHLSRTSFYLSRLYALFYGAEVIYFNGERGFLKSNQGVLSRYKFFRVSHFGNDLKDKEESYKIAFEASAIAYEKFIEKNALKLAADKKLRVDSVVDRKRSEYMYKDDLVSNMYRGSLSALPLIKKVTHLNNVLFFPSTIADYLCLKSLNLSVSIQACFIQSIATFLLKIWKLVGKTIQASAAHQESAGSGITSEGVIGKPNNEKYRIAFFPHHGFRYGNSFYKDYLFKGKSSLVNKTIAFEIDRPTSQNIEIAKKWGVDYRWFYSSISKKEQVQSLLQFLFQNIVTFFKRSDSFIEQIVTNTLVLKKYYECRRVVAALSKYPRLEKVFFHYDILSPRAILLVCSILKIKAISFQNRFSQFHFYRFLSLDEYFVSGRAFVPLFESHSYFVSKYNAIGALRSQKILEHKEDDFDVRFKNYYGGGPYVVFFGLFIFDDFDVGLYGEDGTGYQSNLELLNLINRLASSFSDFRVIYRPKLLGDRDRKLISNIKFRDNVFIDEDLDKFSSYELASQAELVIGKHSAILDECYSAGKKVIVYDNENFSGEFHCSLEEAGLVTRDEASLNILVKKLLEMPIEKFLDEQKSYLNSYYSGLANEDREEKIRVEVSKNL